jgi:MazG family protein
MLSKEMESFNRLLEIIARLRDPVKGCPWDVKQTHESLKPHLLEEAHEVLEAIDHGPEMLKRELGDLLLQVLLHSQIASEASNFNIDDVCALLADKLVERHPHVFGNLAVSDVATVKKNWEKIKREKNDQVGVLSGIPRGLPSLAKAQRMGDKASSVGFDWNEAPTVIQKIREELDELEEALKVGAPADRYIQEELGDLLFSIAQFCRKLELNSEDLLQQANNKFAKRFAAMEKKSHKALLELSATELETLWQSVKDDEVNGR